MDKYANFNNMYWEFPGIFFGFPEFPVSRNFQTLIAEVLRDAQSFLQNNQPKGYLIQKIETNSSGNEMRTNIEFHPFR